MAAEYFPLFLCETNEMTISVTERVGVLEEKVKNHITFFWTAVGALGLWLGWVSVILYQTHSSVGSLAQNQANTPAQIVAEILKKQMDSPQDAQESLATASMILRSSPIKSKKPSLDALKPIADELSRAADRYPKLPEVWQATGEFINYKSVSLVSSAAQIAEKKPCGFGAGPYITYRNCEISLEKVAQTMGGNSTNGGPTPYLFINCVVDYSGGAIPDGPMTFVGSEFRFHVSTTPSLHAQETMRLIAASDSFDQISIPRKQA
jgi:hypothetical protein